MAMSILYLLEDFPLGAHHGKVLHNHGKVLHKQHKSFHEETRAEFVCIAALLDYVSVCRD